MVCEGERVSWQLQAACRGVPTEVFYPERSTQVASPLAVCASCPVRAHCLAEALDREEMGVWGGMTADDRRKLRRSIGARLDRPENVIVWDFLKGWADTVDDEDEAAEWAS